MQRLSQILVTMPLLWAGMLVVLGYFACTVMWAIYERCKR
jgi:hypothetical protein